MVARECGTRNSEGAETSSINLASGHWRSVERSSIKHWVVELCRCWVKCGGTRSVAGGYGRLIISLLLSAETNRGCPFSLLHKKLVKSTYYLSWGFMGVWSFSPCCYFHATGQVPLAARFGTETYKHARLQSSEHCSGCWSMCAAGGWRPVVSL